MSRFGTLHGIEITSGDALGDLFGKRATMFAAYNLSLDGIPSYVGTTTLMAGFKFGEWSGQGVRILVSYRSGLEPFGQYFDVRRQYWSLGLLFDVW
jgi:hypothetical protein